MRPSSIFTIVYIISCLCPFSSAGTAYGDELVLTNGDRLTGTIIRKENATLTFLSTMAGEVKIAWEDLVSLTSEKKVILLLADQNIYESKLSSAGSRLALISGREEPIAYEHIQFINPPSYLQGKGVAWKGWINASMVIINGNADTENIHTDAEVQARTRKSRYTLGGAYNYAATSDLETESNSKGYGKYHYFLSKKVYGLADISLEEDAYKDLNLRTTIGVGLGFQVFESKARNLSLESGLHYINEDFIVAEDEETPAYRWALKYDKKLTRSGLIVFHNHEVFIGLEDSEDLLLNAAAGLKVPAAKQLYVTMEAKVDWDNIPAAGKKRTDTTYIMGLGWSF